MKIDLVKSDVNQKQELASLIKQDSSFVSLESIISEFCPSIRPLVYLKKMQDLFVSIRCVYLGKYLKQYKEVFEYNVQQYTKDELISLICEDLLKFSDFVESVVNLQDTLDTTSETFSKMLDSGFDIEFVFVPEKNRLIHFDKNLVVFGITLESLCAMYTDIYLFKEGSGIISLLRRDELDEISGICGDIFTFMRKFHKTKLGKLLGIRVRHTPESIIKSFYKTEVCGDVITILKEGMPYLAYNKTTGEWVS